MADDYTPTDEEVRRTFAPWVNYGGVIDAPRFLKYDEALVAFDRWLARHDAQVKAEALREFPRVFDRKDRKPYHAGYVLTSHIAELAEETADRIEKEAGL